MAKIRPVGRGGGCAGCVGTPTPRGAKKVRLTRSKNIFLKIIQNNVVMVELITSMNFQQFDDFNFN